MGIENLSNKDHTGREIGAWDRPEDLNNGIYKLQPIAWRWFDAQGQAGGDTLFVTVNILESRAISEGLPEYHPPQDPDSDIPYQIKIPGFGVRNSHKRAFGQMISLLARTMGKNPHDKRDWIADCKKLVAAGNDPR